MSRTLKWGKVLRLRNSLDDQQARNRIARHSLAVSQIDERSPAKSTKDGIVEVARSLDVFTVLAKFAQNASWNKRPVHRLFFKASAKSVTHLMVSTVIEKLSGIYTSLRNCSLMRKELQSTHQRITVVQLRYIAFGNARSDVVNYELVDVSSAFHANFDLALFGIDITADRFLTYAEHLVQKHGLPGAQIGRGDGDAKAGIAGCHVRYSQYCWFRARGRPCGATLGYGISGPSFRPPLLCRSGRRNSRSASFSLP